MDILIEEMNKGNIQDVMNIQDSHIHEILSEDTILKDLSSPLSYYIYAKVDDKVVGFCGINILHDHADITGIAVQKELCNKGIGKTLIRNIMSKCKSLNLNEIFLEVRESNTAAQTFYESLNFEKINERKGYYDKGKEDAYIYVLKLKVD